MNGKKARQLRREQRQREAAQILSELVRNRGGLSVIDVDDDRGGDIVRITDYSDTDKGRVVFDDTDAAD